MAHATLVLSFNTPINTSVQVGDIGYFTQVASNVINNNDFDSNYTVPNWAPIQEIGPITIIDVVSTTQTLVTFEIHTWSNVTGGANLQLINVVDLSQWLIMFSKDNSVNLSNLLGYYSKARFKNNSPQWGAELYSVGSEVQQSSK